MQTSIKLAVLTITNNVLLLVSLLEDKKKLIIVVRTLYYSKYNECATPYPHGEWHFSLNLRSKHVTRKYDKNIKFRM